MEIHLRSIRTIILKHSIAFSWKHKLLLLLLFWKCGNKCNRASHTLLRRYVNKKVFFVEKVKKRKVWKCWKVCRTEFVSWMKKFQLLNPTTVQLRIIKQMEIYHMELPKKSDGNKEKKIKYIIQKYVCMFRKESEESWVDVDSSGSMFYIAMFIMRPKNQIKRREIYRWI